MSFLQSERIIEVQDQQEMVGILGRNDELLRVSRNIMRVLLLRAAM